MEAPWRYMADLPLEHVPTIRRYVPSLCLSPVPIYSTSLKPHTLFPIHHFANTNLLNRVMLLIYHKLNPDEILFPRPELNWTFLTRTERQRVKTMVEESKDNDLLEQMLGWFAAKFMHETNDIEFAAQTLKEHITYAVRHPKSYQSA